MILLINAGKRETTVTLTPYSLPGGPDTLHPLPLTGCWHEPDRAESMRLGGMLTITLTGVSRRLLIREDP